MIAHLQRLEDTAKVLKLDASRLNLGLAASDQLVDDCCEASEHWKPMLAELEPRYAAGRVGTLLARVLLSLVTVTWSHY